MTEQTVASPSVGDLPESALDALAKKRIFFGHQSVGFDIIRGMEELLEDNPQIPLRILEIKDLSAATSPGLFHFEVGKNRDPLGKIRAFASGIENDKEGGPDIAFFKFCYVDIEEESDVQEILQEYERTMSRLALAFPKTAFVHLTIPLTGMPSGLDGWVRRAKNLVKKVMGRPVADLSDNRHRHELNELLREKHSAPGSLLDLARMESTFPDGRRNLGSKGGKSFYSLVGKYTDDGGHLNALGRRIVAEQFLILLAKASR